MERRAPSCRGLFGAVSQVLFSTISEYFRLSYLINDRTWTEELMAHLWERTTAVPGSFLTPEGFQLHAFYAKRLGGASESSNGGPYLRVKKYDHSISTDVTLDREMFPVPGRQRDDKNYDRIVGIITSNHRIRSTSVE